MIKYVYCFKNIKSSNFGNPQLEVLDKDAAKESYSRHPTHNQGQPREKLIRIYRNLTFHLVADFLH